MAASNTVQIIIDAVDQTRAAFGSAAAGLEKLKNDITGFLKGFDEAPAEPAST